MRAADVGASVEQTLQRIALAVWGDASLWYLIADANGLVASSTIIEGQSLVIPNVVTNIHNNATTFRVYNPGALIGDTNPTLPDPPPPPQRDDNRCGALAAVIVIAITIVVAVVAPEALGVTDKFWAAVIGSAAGSVAGQEAAITLGLQDEFSWKAVGVAALTAGLTQGLHIDKNISDPALREATKNAINQGANILLGQQEKFSWPSLFASAISAPINEKIDKKFGSVNNNRPNAGYIHLPGGGAPFSLDRLGTNLIGEFLKSATRSAATILANRGGRLDWENVATQALGDAIGNTVASDIQWRKTNAATRDALDRSGIRYTVNDDGTLKTASPYTQATVDTLIRRGYSPSDIAKVLNDPGLREQLLTHVEVDQDGRVTRYREDGTVSLPRSEPMLVEDLTNRWVEVSFVLVGDCSEIVRVRRGRFV